MSVIDGMGEPIAPTDLPLAGTDVEPAAPRRRLSLNYSVRAVEDIDQRTYRPDTRFHTDWKMEIHRCFVKTLNEDW